jgi:hypothetical protein
MEVKKCLKCSDLFVGEKCKCEKYIYTIDDIDENGVIFATSFERASVLLAEEINNYDGYIESVILESVVLENEAGEKKEFSVMNDVENKYISIGIK